MNNYGKSEEVGFLRSITITIFEMNLAINKGMNWSSLNGGELI